MSSPCTSVLTSQRDLASVLTVAGSVCFEQRCSRTSACCCSELCASLTHFSRVFTASRVLVFAVKRVATSALTTTAARSCAVFTPCWAKRLILAEPRPRMLDNGTGRDAAFRASSSATRREAATSAAICCAASVAVRRRTARVVELHRGAPVQICHDQPAQQADKSKAACCGGRTLCAISESCPQLWRRSASSTCH